MYQNFYCPVVSHLFLGRDTIEEIHSFHCDDCKATHTFYPGVASHSSKLDYDCAKSCDCAQCKSK